jgi:Cytosolic carboxypeptidase N-terminal domain
MKPNDAVASSGKIHVAVEGLTFRSNFDSGNLMHVKHESGAFSLLLSRDCEGTAHQRRNSSWFHFAISGARPGQSVTLRISNLTRQVSISQEQTRHDRACDASSLHLSFQRLVHTAPKCVESHSIAAS